MDSCLQNRGIRKVLLIRRKALGDCLVTLQAVRDLAAALPQAKFDLIIDRPFAPLIALFVPEVRIVPWHGSSQGDFAWYRKLRSENYDLVLDWLGSPRTALWTAASGAAMRVGYDLSRRGWAYNIKVPQNQLQKIRLGQFAGEAFLDPLRVLGLNPAPWQPGPPVGWEIAIPEDALGANYLQWKSRWLASSGSTVAMMMSATWPAKAWPHKNIVQLCREVEAEQLRPLIIPGPGDEELEAVLRQELPSEIFAPPTSLLELADLLGHCIAFAGTDCGGRHLASALGLPTVTVFGPTNSEGWNPNHPRHVAIKKNLDCLGCDLKICPLPGHPCLDDLPAASVVSGLRRVLENTRE